MFPTVIFAPDGTAQNLPPIDTAHHSFFLSVSTSYVASNHSLENTRVLQIAVDIEDYKTYLRVKKGTGWSNWQRVQYAS
jgi:hypothetical protein